MSEFDNLLDQTVNIFDKLVNFIFQNQSIKNILKYIKNHSLKYKILYDKHKLTELELKNSIELPDEISNKYLLIYVSNWLPKFKKEELKNNLFYYYKDDKLYLVYIQKTFRIRFILIPEICYNITIYEIEKN